VLIGLLALTIFYHFCLVLEWSGITKALDPFEDFIGALLPMWWVFIFYAFLQNIMGGDLRESEKKFRNLIDTSPTAISIIRKYKYLYVNSSWEDLTGYSKEEVQTLNPLNVVHPDMREQVRTRAEDRIKGIQVPTRYEMKGINKNGDVIWYDFAATVIQYDNEPAILNIAADITNRKMNEGERERLIDELKKALDNIKTLKGLLPICAKCKKIRDDKGYWKQIDAYIEAHTDASFSHGLCPECMDKIYGDEDWYKKRRS